MRMRTSRVGSIQSKLIFSTLGFLGDELGELQRDLTYLGIGAADAILDRPSDRWAELERINPTDNVGELIGQNRFQFDRSRSRAATSLATITACAKKSLGN